jgi:hypothetical protein
MMLDDLFDNTYPNATFHDSTIEKIELNYLRKEARLFCEIQIGDPDAKKESDREAKERGVLNISGLQYCVIEPPHASYSYKEAVGLWIDGEIINEKEKEKQKSFPRELPLGKFTCYFFVRDWNAFIYIAAEQANFVWSD